MAKGNKAPVKETKKPAKGEKAKGTKPTKGAKPVKGGKY